MKRRLLLVTLGITGAVACGSADRTMSAEDGDGGGPASPPSGAIVPREAGVSDAGKVRDAGHKSDAGVSTDGGSAHGDGGSADASTTTLDGGAAANDAGSTSSGPITGGPCVSGAAGSTAFRVKWTNAGGKAQANYEVNGLPDKSRAKASAYGYQIGFTSSYVDPYLATGGLLLDSSDFVDIELSTVGLTTIHGVTLSLLGRSYDTTTSGSFNWQTFVGTGASPSGAVSNAAPYTWTSSEATPEFSPGDGTVLLRIKAGPPSSTLVVSRIELCVDAD